MLKNIPSPGLVPGSSPGVHVLKIAEKKTWVAGSSPAKGLRERFYLNEYRASAAGGSSSGGWRMTVRRPRFHTASGGGIPAVACSGAAAPMTAVVGGVPGVSPLAG